MCLHVERYPPWILALVVPAWAGTAFAGTWISGWIAQDHKSASRRRAALDRCRRFQCLYASLSGLVQTCEPARGSNRRLVGQPLVNPSKSNNQLRLIELRRRLNKIVNKLRFSVTISAWPAMPSLIWPQ